MSASSVTTTLDAPQVLPVRWQERPADTDVVQQLQHELALGGAMARVLAARGVSSTQQAEKYLAPSLHDLPDPDGFAGMGAAVDRLTHAMRTGETVGVFGDYDVDGVTATTLLAEFLEALDVPTVFTIPNRLTEGYGMSRPGIDRLRDQSAKLIVAVDCGITNHEEIAYATAAGMDVIVIDHHRVGPDLPKATAVINPHRPDCTRGGQHMCAVAVAFNVCMALRRTLRAKGFFHRRPEPNLGRFFDLVALGTVADVMPLVQDNRILVHWGIRHIGQGKRPGMRALVHAADIPLERVSCGTLGFHLAPRVNAAGRLEDAADAVRLLKTADWQQAATLAEQLDDHNRRRRQLESEITEQAARRIEQEPQLRDCRILIVADEAWHPGVVGIVASRLVDRFGRPTLVIGAGGKGSGRSIPAFHLHEAVLTVREHLAGFGGHAHAVGVSLKPGHFPVFRDTLVAYAAQRLTPEDLGKTLLYDGALQPDQVHLELAEVLQQAAPFGRGNPQGVFRFNDVRCSNVRLLKGAHLKGTLHGDHKLPFIAFGLAEKQPLLDAPVDLLAAVTVNEWQGRRDAQLQVVDIAPAGQRG